MFLKTGCTTLVAKASGKVNRWLTLLAPARGRSAERASELADNTYFRGEIWDAWCKAQGRLSKAYPFTPLDAVLEVDQ